MVSGTRQLHGPLDALPPALRAELLSLGRDREYADGDVIVRHGGAHRSVHIIRSGHVKVVVATEGGEECLLAVLGPGDVLGELAALDGGARSATVRALGPVSATEVGRARFLVFLRSNPDAMMALLAVLARRLRGSDTRTVDVVGRSVEARLARRLLEIAASHGEVVDEGVLITLPLSHEDLAAWIGASREAVTHALGRMRRSGIVRTGRLRIVIRDLEALGATATR